MRAWSQIYKKKRCTVAGCPSPREPSAHSGEKVEENCFLNARQLLSFITGERKLPVGDVSLSSEYLTSGSESENHRRSDGRPQGLHHTSAPAQMLQSQGVPAQASVFALQDPHHERRQVSVSQFFKICPRWKRATSV